MKTKIIRRQKLSQCIDLEKIHSIVLREGRFGDSLAIALKGRTPDNNSGFRTYGGGCMYVSLDKFTYRFPAYVALPKECYDSIVLIKKEVGDMRFIRARITKPVNW